MVIQIIFYKHAKSCKRISGRAKMLYVPVKTSS